MCARYLQHTRGLGLVDHRPILHYGPHQLHGVVVQRIEQLRRAADAIHAVRRDGCPAAVWNEIPLCCRSRYVKLPDGSPSRDSIGNIFDPLREC